MKTLKAVYLTKYFLKNLKKISLFFYKKKDYYSDIINFS